MKKKTIFEIDDFCTYDLDALREILAQAFGENKVFEMACVPKDLEDAERVRYFFQVGYYRIDSEPEATVSFRCSQRSKERLEAAANERGISVSELLRHFAASSDL